MSDPTTITRLLQETLVGTTESVKQAQKSLQQLHEDPNFMPHLLLIPKQTSIPYNIQKAAIVYTLAYTRQCIIKKDQAKLKTLADCLTNSMGDTSIQLTLRKHIGSTLEFILGSDRQGAIRMLFQGRFIEWLTHAQHQEDSNVNFQFLGLCAQTIMSSVNHISKELTTFLRNSFLSFVLLNLRIFGYVKEAIGSGVRDKIINCFRILRIYSYALKQYLKKIIYADIQTVKLLYEEQVTMLISTSLELTLPNNQLETPLIFWQRNQDREAIELFHALKADYVTCLSCIMRTLLQNFKQPKMVLANAILQAPQLIPSLINATVCLFTKISYHKIKSRSLVKLIQQIYNTLIVAVRSHIYYPVFVEYKQAILHGCIFKTLEFSPQDYDNFFYEPDEFINEVLQIVQMNPSDYLNNRKKQTALDSEGYEEIQNYGTLRTVSSTLLNSFCCNIDGSLPEIFNYALQVFSKNTDIQFPKSLLLLLLGVLRDLALERKGLSEQVVTTLTAYIKNKKIPSNTREPDDITKQDREDCLEYLMLFLVLYKYLPKCSDLELGLIPELFEIVCQLLTGQNIPQALRFVAYDMVIIISSHDKQYGYGVRFVEMLNHFMVSNRYEHLDKILQTLYNLFKYQDTELSKKPEIVISTVTNLALIIQKQVKKQQHVQLIINKSWNIISDICENQIFIPQLIPQIQQAILPLIPFLDGKQTYDFEQNIFMMMSSFIKKSKAVTQNQLAMFDFIPKLFYSSYNFMFGQAFETLQIFIFYGSNILASAPQALITIIQMCVCSMNCIKVGEKRRNEAENCQGVLLLHSLILSCGNSFDAKMWVTVASALTKRLEQPVAKTNILRSNLLAGLGLVVMVGHKNFSEDDCDLLLNRILQNYSSFTVKYSIKVLIVALSEMMGRTDLSFIVNRFTYILDCLVCLLEAHSSKADLFSKNPITEDQRDYDTFLSTIKNAITDMDEINHFKTKIAAVRQINPVLLQQAINELPEQRKDYLKEIMSVSKVMNEQRKIFKIKK